MRLPGIHPTWIGIVVTALLAGGCSIITDFDNEGYPDPETDGGMDVLVLPNCHNSVVDEPEECDDGNSVPWDGCNECIVVERQVNDTVAGHQSTPAVATGWGRVIVAWTSADASGGTSLFAKIYEGDGEGQFFVAVGEFAVNEPTGGAHTNPVITTYTGSGQDTFFVVIYETDGDIWGQAIDALGNRLGNPVLINEHTDEGQGLPAVVPFFSSQFLVVWLSNALDSDHSVGLSGRNVDEHLIPVGPEFRVNSTEAGTQASPAIAGTDVQDPRDIVVWEGDGSNGLEIFAQLFTTDGTFLGPEFQVNTTTDGDQRKPAVAHEPLGEFVVVWESFHQGSQPVLMAQKYDAQAIRDGEEFEVGSVAHVTAQSKWVTYDWGGINLFWLSDDGDDWGIIHQVIPSDGSTRTPETFNAFTTGRQHQFSAGLTGVNFNWYCWSSEGDQDTDGSGIFCRMAY